MNDPTRKSTVSIPTAARPRIQDVDRSSLREVTRKEIPIDSLKASIPAALADGRIPVSALDPHLLVRAPTIDIPGLITAPGDLFEADLNGKALTDTTTPYGESGEKFVDLKIAKSHFDELEDGVHAISYRVSIRPFGDTVISGKTRLVLDRKPPGGRYLPRIVFDEALELEGVSLATLLSLPDGKLTGILPDYADIDPLDMIHAFVRLRGSATEVPAGVVSASTDGQPMSISFGRDVLEKLESPGRVDFYYYIIDALGVRSDPSTPTALRLSILNSPEILPAPILTGAEDGLITDTDARPELVVQIPPMTPAARAGDTVQLFLGPKSFQPVEIEADDVGDSEPTMLSIDYSSMRELAEMELSAPFELEAHYIHRRDGIASRSERETYAFDLTLPGGWDPQPQTPENEALAIPVLRGRTGSIDNVIDFNDSLFPATVHIAAPSSARNARHDLAVDDVIVVQIGNVPVGAPFTVVSDTDPISVEIPVIDLQANAGTGLLSYTVARSLSTKPHTSMAISPLQVVRIDSIDALPGGGNPLASAIFLMAREREKEHGTYGLFSTDFVDGVTPLRVYGYTNMNEGDQITITYEGFDRIDGGDPVHAADGELAYRVAKGDLNPKPTPDPETGDLVYVDIDFPDGPAKTVAYGRLAYVISVSNAAGSGASPNTSVAISTRF
jgi:hypothetical protein